MKKIVILGCTKTKHEGMMEARLLYEKSNLFRLCKKFCQKHKYEYVIISAKYGIIYPKTEIKNYDETFSNKSKINQMQKIIVPKMLNIISSYSEVIVLCGDKYIQTFKPIIDKKFQFPLKGKKIGERMQWLKKEIE